MKSKKDKTIIDVVMPNGKYYSEGFNDIMSIMSLRSKRFHTLHIPNDFKFSIFEHMSLCGVLVSKYCEFMANEFHTDEIKKGTYADLYRDPNTIYKMYQMVLCHDIEECIIGDIPSPVKIEFMEDHKKNIRENILNFLAIKPDSLNVINVAVKHIDVVAAFIELFSYKDVLDLKQHKNMFKYYSSKISDFQIESFIKKISEDLWIFYKELEK